MGAFRWLVKHKASFGQLVRFGIVGGSGVVVNLLVAFAAKKISPKLWTAVAWLTPCDAQPEQCGVTATRLCGAENTVLWQIPGTTFNIRWYHAFSIIAFVVANVWNYELNRLWTFRAVVRSVQKPGWWSAFQRFFAVGLLAQLIGMAIETLLMNPTSPIHLSCTLFDGSTGFRTRWYWAHLAMILVTIPVSFLLNKFWSFRARKVKATQPTDETEGAP
jgi:putative flippase GtrA